MAHLVDSLAWSGQVPWHGLGTKLPENVTGEDMVRVAGLDWNVIPKPLFAGLDEATGYGVSVPGYKALVREGSARGHALRRLRVVRHHPEQGRAHAPRRRGR